MIEPSTLCRICNDRDSDTVVTHHALGASEATATDQRCARYRRDVLDVTRCAWWLCGGEAA